MEDRHTVSEPRPLSAGGGDGAKWEVDIIRDGNLIVDTFTISKEVLPPRKNKKGKVLWRLPSDLDKMPSFGVHETSRILDIFKERKKKRKKQGKEGAKSPGTAKKRELSPPENGEEGGGKLSNAKSKKSGKENGQSSENVNAKERDVRAGKHPQLQAARMRLGGIGQRQNKKQHKDADNSNSGSSLQQSPIQPKDTYDSTTQQTEAPDTPDPSRLSLEDAATTKQQCPDETSRPAAKASAISVPPPDALFIVVPRNELPAPLPGEAQPSLAVPAARHFVNTYYQYFSNGQINDLARYYTAKGQKSVSIGGAHSVVTGRNDIATQILSLAGSAFVVRGVVAQDTVDGNGAHILVTGTALTGSGGVTANFAHSVSLTLIEDVVHRSESDRSALTSDVESGFSFQIHNDALALLGEAAPITQPQSTHTAPAQNPPPPPGLF